MTTNQLFAACELLKNAGRGEAYWDMQHDIAYIPWEYADGPVADGLKKIGCHWESDVESWALF